jgi:F-type H+-transporting ATPase subunit c
MVNRKIFIYGAFLLALLIGTGAAFAADGAEEVATGSKDMLYISAAFGMAMVSSAAAFSMAMAVKSFAEGASRNPGASDKLQFGLIVTLVLIETLALYVFVIIFLKVS